MKNQNCPICGRTNEATAKICETSYCKFDFRQPVCKNCEQYSMRVVRLEDGSEVCQDCFNETEATYILVRIKRGWVPEWLFWLFEGLISYPPFRQIFTKKV